MKKTLFISLLLVNTLSFTQINVGPEIEVSIKKKKFDEADLAALKKTTTYFVYRESDVDDLKNFKQTLSEAWQYTPIQFVSYDEFTAGNLEANSSFFTINGFYRLNGNLQTIQYYLTLSMKVKGVLKSFCRIDLHTDWPSALKAQSATSTKAKNEVTKHLYTNAKIYNWNLPFLKNALQFVDQKLDNSEEFWMFSKGEYKNVSMLKKETLFVPDYVFIKFNKFSGDESKRIDEGDVFKNYPYEYKVLPVDELNDLIAKSSKPVYYLSMVRSSTDMYITVFDGVSGEAVYYNYAPVSYNISSDDTKELMKAIDKPKI